MVSSVAVQVVLLEVRHQSTRRIHPACFESKSAVEIIHWMSPTDIVGRRKAAAVLEELAHRDREAIHAKRSVCGC